MNPRSAGSSGYNSGSDQALLSNGGVSFVKCEASVHPIQVAMVVVTLFHLSSFNGRDTRDGQGLYFMCTCRNVTKCPCGF